MKSIKRFWHECIVRHSPILGLILFVSVYTVAFLAVMAALTFFVGGQVFKPNFMVGGLLSAGFISVTFIGGVLYIIEKIRAIHGYCPHPKNSDWI